MSGGRQNSQVPLVQPARRTKPNNNIRPIPSSTSVNANKFSSPFSTPPVQPAPRTESSNSLLPIPSSTSVNGNKISTPLSSPLVQPLIRIVHGNNVYWSCKAEFTMSMNKDGRNIRFSHCPELTFHSKQFAYDYFQLQAKLHHQRTFQSDQQQRLQRLQAAQLGLQAAQLGLQVAQKRLEAEQQSYLVEDLSLRAGQLADFATQQACFAKVLNPFEPVWQFDPPLQQIGVQPIVNLPKLLSHSASDFQYQPANEPLSEGEWEEPNPVQSSSMSSPLEPPPQTLFAESTPHAQEVQAQSRVRLPVKGSQSWPFQSQVTNDDSFMHCLSPQPAMQARSIHSVSHESSTCKDTALPQMLTNEVDISNQSPNSHEFSSLPSYADTVFPQTLNRKDRRALGVSLSASNDE